MHLCSSGSPSEKNNHCSFLPRQTESEGFPFHEELLQYYLADTVIFLQRQEHAVFFLLSHNDFRSEHTIQSFPTPLPLLLRLFLKLFFPLLFYLYTRVYTQVKDYTDISACAIHESAVNHSLQASSITSKRT